MRRKRAKASRSKSQVSMAWASRTRVRAHAASEGKQRECAGGLRARGTSVIHRCCVSIAPAEVRTSRSASQSRHRLMR